VRHGALFPALLLVLLLVAGCTSTSGPSPSLPAARTAPTAGTTPSTAAPSPTPAPKVPTIRDEVVQSGLSLPWDVAFLPDGRMLVTERVGNVIVFESGEPNARRLANLAVPGVRAQGESGLMGIAVDPGFSRTGHVFVCASRMDEGQWRNQILRLRLEGTTLALDGFVVREGMRAAPIHDGCRLAFGPDGKLWATMGEAGQSALAQDPASLNGKILRVNGDGSIPDDNPVLPGASARTAAYSFGHRNPQGLAFEPGTGRPFAVEHGDDDHDEINLLRPGANYGWPRQAGPGGGPRGFVDPLWTSGPAGTLATSGAAFVSGAPWGLWSGSLFVAQLKEQDLRRFTIDGEGGGPLVATHREVLLDRKYGRLRSPVLAPNGALYVTTSNGAGDRVIRVVATQ
jgi:glucose/arabinose dehydrogenase